MHAISESGAKGAYNAPNMWSSTARHQWKQRNDRRVADLIVAFLLTAPFTAAAQDSGIVGSVTDDTCPA